MLRKRIMPSVPTLPSLRPALGAEQDCDVLIEECLAAIRRSDSFAGDLSDYPFVDDLTHDQWRQFMWIHAAHHLSFLVPEEDCRRGVSRSHFGATETDLLGL
ncbi:MAG: DUF1569 domain-containing protein [Planctomycetota bacterium]